MLRVLIDALEGDDEKAGCQRCAEPRPPLFVNGGGGGQLGSIVVSSPLTLKITELNSSAKNLDLIFSKFV